MRGRGVTPLQPFELLAVSLRCQKFGGIRYTRAPKTPSDRQTVSAVIPLLPLLPTERMLGNTKVGRIYPTLYHLI
jgi:hypothetical protein